MANPTFALSNPNNVNTFMGKLVGVRGRLQLDSSLNVASLNDGAVDENGPINSATIAISAGQVLATGTGTGVHTWSANITGAGGLTKLGPGFQSLEGVTSYTGDTRVQGGWLRIESGYLADGADVYLSTGSTFILNFAGTDSIRSLYIDGVLQSAGSWGALDSGAQFRTAPISDSGLLRPSIGAVPEPVSSLLMLVGLVIGAGVARARRR